MEKGNFVYVKAIYAEKRAFPEEGGRKGNAPEFGIKFVGKELSFYTTKGNALNDKFGKEHIHNNNR